jgi:hypothetical protein
MNHTEPLQKPTRPFVAVRRFSFLQFVLVVPLLGAVAARGAESSAPPPEWVKQYGQSAVWVDTNAPWPEAAKKGLWPESEPEPAPEPVSDLTADMGTNTTDMLDLELAEIAPPKTTKHEISLSGDFLIGQGNTTMPIGVSLSQIPGVSLNLDPTVASPDRDSTYWGATLSYSYGQAWYLDLSYASGDSSGTVDLDEIASGQTGDFQITDDWLSAYIRYAFPQLRGKRLSAYLRGGVSFIQSEMNLDTTLPNYGLYTQNNETDEIQGNLGFGALYSLYTATRFRVGLQLEGEGFFGTRSQASLEVLPEVAGNVPWTTADFDTLVYGGLGRATVRFEYGLGRSGLFKLFADGGVALRYTLVDYSDVDETPSELLWGPYVKLGARYSF